VKKDKILVEWVKNVIKVRCSKRYSPEYLQVLPKDEGSDPWQWSFEEERVYEKSSAAIAAILAEVSKQESCARSKL
jgi:hypothetical protein